MGSLYIVATPIGNLQDITIRAARTLLEAEFLIAESASKAEILLNFIKENFPEIEPAQKRIISLTEDDEENKLPELINILKEHDAALISEAGTPLVSDPGFKLVREAVARQINVVSVPGATAAITALTVSGLPTDKFFFLGYLPKKESKKIDIIKRLGEIKRILSNTAILYESPHRLLSTLKTIKDNLGEVNVIIARELTKVHEEIRRETVSESIEYFERRDPKGEFVILF